MSEAIPVRPPPAAPLPRRVPPGHRWTPAEQDAHWQALCEAVGALREERPRLRLAPAA
ncbi:hypothetical protein [Streptomyces scabiei]|uniref:hypothetical protein n=1 Tax=Streptomyces scabiei TaxID=1930 RepID=UPI0029B79FEB|nr:hypothetical protein [Streptomyces scabiei]MDX3520752.1 hypothetical protein [Streptomyces scabiei]